MSDDTTAGTVTGELMAVVAAAGEYVAGSEPVRLSNADLVAEIAAREQLRRSLMAADHVLIVELQRRGVAAGGGARSTAALLAETLRLSPGDAAARVRAALSLGPRVSLTGEPMPPLLPAAAAADAAGLLSRDHIAAMVHAISKLPTDLTVEEVEAADQILTDVSLQCPPKIVAQAGQQLLDTLQPDGDEPSDTPPPQRLVSLSRRRDGWFEIVNRLSPECGATGEAVLHAFAAPRPTVDPDTGLPVPDQRTAEQRMHDALHEVFDLALRADTLDITGRRAELIITATEPHTDDTPCPCQTTRQPSSSTADSADLVGDGQHLTPEHLEPESLDGEVLDVESVDPELLEPDLLEPDLLEPDLLEPDLPEPDLLEPDLPEPDLPGVAPETPDRDSVGLKPFTPGRTLHHQRRLRLSRSAYTSFGSRLSAATAQTLCDTAMHSTATLTRAGAVLNFARTRRLATRAQIRALTARDGGCSFPGCDHPPQWCDAHHITAWADGGPTSLTNLTLLCGYHHRSFQRAGWTCHISDGYPVWVPPRHIDRIQTPRRNHRHLIRELQFLD